MNNHYATTLAVIKGHLTSILQPDALATLWPDAATICPVLVSSDEVAQEPNYVQIWPMPQDDTVTVEATGQTYMLAYRMPVRIFLTNSDRAKCYGSLLRLAYSIMGITQCDPHLGRTAHAATASMETPEISYDDNGLVYAACVVQFEINTLADFDGLSAVLFAADEQ